VNEGATNLPHRESQMPSPPLLRELLASGRWRQPSDSVIFTAVPFLREPVDFLLSEAHMRSESSGQCVGVPHMREYLSSESQALPLPWIDAVCLCSSPSTARLEPTSVSHWTTAHPTPIQGLSPRTGGPATTLYIGARHSQHFPHLSLPFAYEPQSANPALHRTATGSIL
jgi:hypothetical protein